MSTLTDIDPEEAALTRAMEMAEVDAFAPDLLPRAEKVHPELKDGDAKTHLEEFIAYARMYVEDREIYSGQHQLHPGWVRENIAPVVLKWEEILAHRAYEAATSTYLGTVGQALILELTVTFHRGFENAYGTRWLTLFKDEKGNVLKYWNTIKIVDPILSQAKGEEVKRDIIPGDQLRLKATVKGHEEYKGVKGTVLQRVRKVEVLKAAEVTP